MARHSVYRQLNQRMSGQLGRFITVRRDAQMSYEDIARELLTDYQISVTGETVRRWASTSAK